MKIGDKTATRDKYIYNKNPRWASDLRTWGEAGVVKEGKDSKTGSKDIVMMFVGYPANRETDSVRIWNPDKNGVVTSQDVIWLKRMFFEHKVEVEPFNMSEDDKVKVKVKVEATDEIENKEEEEDR